MHDEKGKSEQYFLRIAEALERIADQLENRGLIDDADLDIPGERAVDGPSWLVEGNVASLSGELMEFVDREQLDGRAWLDQRVLSDFWDSKGLESRYNLSDKHDRLIEKVEALVTKKREVRERDELQHEEALVPSLVAICCGWAVERELKRLNQADVEAILKMDNPKIRATTIRSVWQQVNLRLKSGG